jgi:hypothetical protein
VVLMRLTAKLASLWLALHPADEWPVLPPDLDLDRLRTARASRSKEKGQRQLAHAVSDGKTQMVAHLTPAGGSPCAPKWAAARTKRLERIRMRDVDKKKTPP